MKIGLDFNGVVKDSIGLKRQVLQEIYGIHTTLETCRKKSLLAAGFSLERYKELNHLVYDTELALRAQPVAGSIDVIKRFSTRHEFLLVTGLLPSGHEYAYRWLGAQGLSDIELVCLPETGSKAEVLEGCSLYSDDDVPRLVEAASVVPEVFYFGPRTSSDGFPAVADWAELETALINVEISTR